MAYKNKKKEKTDHHVTEMIDSMPQESLSTCLV